MAWIRRFIGEVVRRRFGWRRCEKCGGMGPVVWDDFGQTIHGYMCYRCHTNVIDRKHCRELWIGWLPFICRLAVGRRRL